MLKMWRRKKERGERDHSKDVEEEEEEKESDIEEVNKGKSTWKVIARI